MGQEFLQLEGIPSKRERFEGLAALLALAGLGDYSEDEYNSTQRLYARKELFEPANDPTSTQDIFAQYRSGGENDTRARDQAAQSAYDAYTPAPGEPPSVTLEKRKAAYAQAAALWQPTRAGANTIFAAYSLGEEIGLSGFGSWFKRAFTPPRAVRRFAQSAVSHLKPPSQVRNFVSKGLRYAGAAQFSILTGGFAGGMENKIFGLKGGEQKIADIGNKAVRAGAIAAATIVGGNAISSSLSKGGLEKLAFNMGKNYPTLTKGLISTAEMFGKGTVLNKLVGAVGPTIIKDAASGVVMKLFHVKGPNGEDEVAAEQYNKSQIPPEEYAKLPDSSPVPVGEAGSFFQGAPPAIGAGASTAFESNDNEEDDGTVLAESRLDEDQKAELLPPSLAQRVLYDSDDDSIKAQIAKGRKQNRTSEVGVDGLPTLGAIIAHHRQRRR
jgi:hypothetical protein